MARRRAISTESTRRVMRATSSIIALMLLYDTVRRGRPNGALARGADLIVFVEALAVYLYSIQDGSPLPIDSSAVASARADVRSRHKLVAD